MKRLAPALALLLGCASRQTPDALPPRPAPSLDAAASAPAPDASSAPTPSEPAPVRQALPTVGPRPEVPLPAVVRATLSNGMESTVSEQHALPLVHLRLVVRAAGSGSDPREMHGLAAFVGHLLEEGTARHDARALHDAIENLGAALEVTINRDATVLSLTVLREHVETALALLAEVALEPSFPPAELERVRRREVDRLSLEAQDPDWLARETFARELWGEDPYNHTDATEAALRRVGRADAQRFHREHYVAGALSLVAVGDVRAAPWRALVERHFARARRGNAPAASHPPASSASGRRFVLVDRPGSEQSVLRVGLRAVGRGEENYVALTVANQVLGGAAQSRLFMDLRERRSLTYGAYSALGAFTHGGHFVAQASVRTPVTAEAVGAVLENLERLDREEPSAQELSEARDFLTDSFALSMDSGTAVANVLAELRAQSLPDDWWSRARARVTAVQPAEVLSLAQRYLRAQDALVVVVGDASAVRSGLERLGTVRVVDAQGRPRARAAAPEAPHP